ncbi:hypothetical protein V8E53_007276 [Lactarius tabidus]
MFTSRLVTLVFVLVFAIVNVMAMPLPLQLRVGLAGAQPRDLAPFTPIRAYMKRDGMWESAPWFSTLRTQNRSPPKPRAGVTPWFSTLRTQTLGVSPKTTTLLPWRMPSKHKHWRGNSVLTLRSLV